MRKYPSTISIIRTRNINAPGSYFTLSKALLEQTKEQSGADYVTGQDVIDEKEAIERARAESRWEAGDKDAIKKYIVERRTN